MFRDGDEGREVREPGRLAGRVDALDLVVDGLEQQRAGTDEREVVRAGLDDPVAGVVRGEMRVDEVDLHLSPRDTAVRIGVLGPTADTIDDALQHARHDLVLHVGHDSDLDRCRRDADVARGVALGLCQCRCSGEPGGDRQARNHPDSEPPAHEAPPTSSLRRLGSCHKPSICPCRRSARSDNACQLRSRLRTLNRPHANTASLHLCVAVARTQDDGTDLPPIVHVGSLGARLTQ